MNFEMSNRFITFTCRSQQQRRGLRPPKSFQPRRQHQQQRQQSWWHFDPAPVNVRGCSRAVISVVLISSVAIATAIRISQSQSQQIDGTPGDTGTVKNTPTGNTDHNTPSSERTRTIATSPSSSINQSLLSQNSKATSLHAPIGPWRILHPNPYTQICYDTRTRNPIYVQYQLLVAPPSPPSTLPSSLSFWKDPNYHPNATTTKKKKRRPQYHFYEETSIHERFRSRNSHYHHSGFDRGHLAPAADFHHENDNDDDDDDAMIKSTYNLCNISPQYPELNRQLWNQLEQLIRRMAVKYYHEQDKAVTYVTTGPIYLPSSQINEKSFQYKITGIGHPPSLIMVPTHFFKVVVVLDKTETKILYFACFVLPNDPNIITELNRKALQDFVVPWTDLETVTGLTFYPDLVDEPWKEYADQVTRSVQPQQQPLLNHSDTSQIIEGRRPQLFLTDGKRSNGNNLTKSQQQKLYKELQHICANHACVPRKQQKPPPPQ